MYYCPDDAAPAGRWLHPGQSGIFQTGLKFGIPHGYMLEVKNRSSVSAKQNLLVGACVVDSGYDGEIFVNLHNVGTEPRFIQKNMKIAQIVMTPVVHFRPILTAGDDLYSDPITISARGPNALGSTGD